MKRSTNTLLQRLRTFPESQEHTIHLFSTARRTTNSDSNPFAIWGVHNSPLREAIVFTV